MVRTMGRRLVYGIHPVQELLRRRDRRVQGLLVSKPSSTLREIMDQASARNIGVQRLTEAELQALCGSGNHQGIAALVGEYSYRDLEELLAVPQPLLVVLDSVTDPQNLGAIIRSALVLGASGIVIPKDRSASITPTVVKVSAGASEHLPCARVTNLARCLIQLQEEDFTVVGAVEQGGLAPEQAELQGKVALVLGNEHKGIRPLVLRSCTIQITIPTSSSIASLNVGAATVALLAEVSRQRRAMRHPGD